MGIDVLVLKQGDDIAVFDVDAKSMVEVEQFVEAAAEHSRQDTPLEWAIVETTRLDEWGPGDVTEELEAANEMPTATIRKAATS